MRRGTVEVHPIVSEAPPFQELYTSPEIDFSKNQIASCRMTPIAYGIENCCFSKQNWPSDEMGVRNPVIRDTFRRKPASSTVERVKWPDHMVAGVLFCSLELCGGPEGV